MTAVRPVVRSAVRPVARSVTVGDAGGLPLQLGASWWLDATDLSIGGSVSSWADKTSSGYNASQATAGNRPSVVDWGNGKASVSFDGTDDELTIAIPQENVRQVFAVCDTTNIGTGYRSFIERTPTGAPVLLFGAPISYRPLIYWGTEIARQSTTVQRQAVFEWGIFDPAFTRVDNATAASTDHTETTLGTWNKICNASAQQSQVLVAEIVGFKTELSESSRNSLVAYLEHKWGL